MAAHNKYEQFNVGSDVTIPPVEATATWTVHFDKRETVMILTAVMNSGLWVYGYNVKWSNGRTSYAAPCAVRGTFVSQRDAKIHAVGFMQLYAEYFTPEAQRSLSAAENKLLQTTMF